MNRLLFITCVIYVTYATSLNTHPDDWNHLSEIVELNIGGKYFSTYKSTWLNSKGSVLEGMFRERYPVIKDTQGRYFFDRDGSFEHILNYLRTGIMSWPDDETARTKLQTELHYYGIPWNIYFPESVLVTPDHEAKLLEWTNSNHTWELVHRGSRDGFRGEDFYSTCVGSFPTILIVKTTAGWVFGWYQTDMQRYQYLPAKDSFYFTLKNPLNQTHKFLAEPSQPLWTPPQTYEHVPIIFGLKGGFEIQVPVDERGQPRTWNGVHTGGLMNIPHQVNPLMYVNGAKSGVKITEIEAFIKGKPVQQPIRVAKKSEL